MATIVAGMWMLLLMLFQAALTQSQNPPRLVKGYETDFRVKLNNRLEIKCPVEFDSSDTIHFYNWYKDGSSVDSGANSGLDFSYRRSQRYLVIEEALSRHSGIYACEGTGGFGMKRAQFNVQVYDPNNINIRCREINSGKGLAPGAPCFPSLRQSATKRVDAIEGDSVTLRCPAVGVPPPTFRWQKARKSIDWIQNVKGQKTDELRLANVKKKHTGVYTCTAKNKFATIKLTFSLVVQEKYEPPRIEGPMNTTIDAGKSATFTCKVKSSGKAVIRWAKRVSPTRRKDLEMNQEEKLKHLVFNGELYKFIDAVDCAASDKSYTQCIELPIANAQDQDAGKYVCMVIGPKGESGHRSAFLYVNSGRSGPRNRSGSNGAGDDSKLIIYIAVPLSIIICLLVIFCVAKRNRGDCGFLSGSSTTRNTPTRYALKTQNINAQQVPQYDPYPLPISPVSPGGSGGSGGGLVHVSSGGSGGGHHHPSGPHSGTPPSSGAGSGSGSRDHQAYRMPNTRQAPVHTVPPHHNGYLAAPYYPT